MPKGAAVPSLPVNFQVEKNYVIKCNLHEIRYLWSVLASITAFPYPLLWLSHILIVNLFYLCPSLGNGYKQYGH